MISHRSPMPRQQLGDQAAERLRALIMSGELPPGTSVRPEVVASEMDISTTPAREAMQLLRAEGFLDLSPGRGFTVAPLTGDDVRDLFTVQALIAGELAARAAERASPEEIVLLESTHAELVDAAANGATDRLERVNHEFHRQINRIASARKVAWALSLVVRYVPREFYGSIDGWPEATTDDHSALLAAIKYHDSARARAEMHDHITHAGELLASYFDRRTAP